MADKFHVEGSDARSAVYDQHRREQRELQEHQEQERIRTEVELLDGTDLGEFCRLRDEMEGVPIENDDERPIDELSLDDYIKVRRQNSAWVRSGH